MWRVVWTKPLRSAPQGTAHFAALLALSLVAGATGPALSQAVWQLDGVPGEQPAAEFLLRFWWRVLARGNGLAQAGSLVLAGLVPILAASLLLQLDSMLGGPPPPPE